MAYLGHAITFRVTFETLVPDVGVDFGRGLILVGFIFKKLIQNALFL